MDEMLELVKKLVSSSTPKKVLVREEIWQPPTKNVNAISVCKIEKDKDEKHEEFVDKNMVELNKDVNNPIETSAEPIRKATKESIGEERKMVELPEPQPVSFYLNHNINEKLIGGLIGNFRLADEKLVETDVRLALASNLHIYPLGVAEDVLIEVTRFVYPVDFMILDIKEDVKKPLILGTPFLTMARAEIKFDKGMDKTKNHKKTVKNRQARTRERKSVQKPEAKTKETQPPALSISPKHQSHVAMEKAQRNEEFALHSLTKLAQAVTS
ncbi:MAK10-like protein [Tanacetum coccineum]